jgi:hypothetical protein
VVDVHKNEALVMTCAHIFRDSRGEGKIQVDLFASGATGPVPGKVIDYDLERDVALVAIRPGIALAPAPVAGREFGVRPGDAVFSIGCDRGADPSIRESRVTDLNKYVGPANIEVAGAPVIGRSGGGLFSADGRLIGICNLADPKDDEGIYADTSLLHTQLDENNLTWIYKGQPPAAPPETLPSRELAITDPAPAASCNAPPEMAPQMPRTPLDDRDPSPPGSPAAPASSDARPLISLAGDIEVICIVRARRDPNGKSRVFVLDQPSRELLNQLASESHAARDDAGPRVLEASLVGADQAPPRQDTSGRGPVMRGQAE